MPQTNRRDFLKACSAIAGGALSSSLTLAATESSQPVADTIFVNRESRLVSQVEEHKKSSQTELARDEEQRAGRRECNALRGLVILAEFPGTVNSGNVDQINLRFKALDQYVRVMSYGRFCLETTITSRWYQLPSPVSRYKISPINLQVDETRVRTLVDDALTAAETENEITGYDFIAVVLGAKFLDFGMPGFSAYPGMLGWHPNRPIKTNKGIPVRGVAVFVTNAHMGTYFHDIAHVIGGVDSQGNRVMPCLYDHDLQAKGPTRIDWVNSMINMGFWDPMSCHFYNPTQPPPGLSSWSKLRLGWLPKDKMKTLNLAIAEEVLLGPLQDASADTVVIRVPIAANRYFLIENRQPTDAYDQGLPGHGVLIMKVDDRIPECRHGDSPVRLVDANPDQKWLMGAAFNLPTRSQYIDKQSGVKIELLEKVGLSYLLRVSKSVQGNLSE